MEANSRKIGLYVSLDYLDSPYSLNGNSGEGVGVKNEKAVREFEDRNILQLFQSRFCSP